MSHFEDFFEGYIEAAAWSSMDTLNGEDVHLDDYEWAEGQEERLKESALDFFNANLTDLEAYIKARGFNHRSHTGWSYAGHDFWLTRNRHGAGFWDRGLGVLGERLSDTARVYGSIDLYLGDDELIYAA